MKLAWLLVLTACANPLLGLREHRTVHLEQGQVTVRFGPEDEATHSRVEAAIAQAARALTRWGGLETEVTVNLLPSHVALEQATGRYFGWLRAWGQYDAIAFQSPRTWQPPLRDDELVEWLTHELTHCVMFQRSGSALTWNEKAIPLWFREGLATITADQGYRYESLESLASWQLAHPDLDVFAQGEALSETSFTQVYGLSHHAMTFFLRRYGDVAVLAAMHNMHDGDQFPAAFTKAVGITPGAFAREFENYLRLRGFRGFGLPMRHAAPPSTD